MYRKDLVSPLRCTTSPKGIPANCIKYRTQCLLCMDNVKLLLRNGSLQQLPTSNNVLGVVVWCLLQDSIFLFYPLYLLCVFWQYKLPLTVALIPPTLGYTIITYSLSSQIECRKWSWDSIQICHAWEDYLRKISVERRKISWAECRAKFSLKTAIFRKYPSQPIRIQHLYIRCNYALNILVYRSTM